MGRKRVVIQFTITYHQADTVSTCFRRAADFRFKQWRELLTLDLVVGIFSNESNVVLRDHVGVQGLRDQTGCRPGPGKK